MGSRGPISKRDSERIRTNAESQADHVKRTGRVRVPAADKTWHPKAIAWYRSLKHSGQSDFYEPSDWAQAWIWAAILSKMLNAPLSAEVLKAWQAGARDLHTTEAARRRSHIEVDRGDPADTDEFDVPDPPALTVVANAG